MSCRQFQLKNKKHQNWKIKQDKKMSETFLASARDDKFYVNRNLTKNVILAGELEAIFGL